MDKSFLIFLAIPIFFLMICIELVYGYLKGKNNYRLNDTITSINIGLISRFPTILNLGFQGLTFSYVATNMNLFQLPISSPLTWIFAFVLYDFLYYWMHRFHHEYKFLWATHVVHHHGEEFNLSTALRQTSSGFLWKWIFFLPILLVGIPSPVFVAVGGLNLIYQFWVHTEH
ncbi:MAG: sterol desaturase family protein, partial [Pseudomonadota bacterium]|nr:sterol desaturase family protein [Pseudomonadota bacterium]